MQWVGTISIYTVMPQYFHSIKGRVSQMVGCSIGGLVLGISTELQKYGLATKYRNDGRLQQWWMEGW